MHTKWNWRVALVGLMVLALVGGVVACGRKEEEVEPTAMPTEEVAEEPMEEPAEEPMEEAAEEPMDEPAEELMEEGGSISVAGSTTIQPLAELWGEAFAAANPDVTVDVQGGGSSVGVKSAAQGQADVGMASREIKQSELDEFPDLQVFTIAKDAIAIVVHPDVGVDDLSMDQVRDVFSGAISNWREVGGADAAIVVVSREEGSGTRGAFEEIVMGDALIVDTAILQPSNGAVRTTVSTTPDSIAFLSLGYLDESVKALSIGGVEATQENALSGTYPVVRPLNLLTGGEPSPLIQAWIDFINGPSGQAIVAGEGYLPVGPIVPTGLAGSISVAGSTTIQPLAELWAEAFAAYNPDVTIDVQGGGSSVGVKSAAEGQADVGMASREIRQSELDEYPDLNVVVIAKDAIAIVVHPDVAVDGLAMDQVRDIFSGAITNWSEVGGADAAIVVVSREEGSGTRGAFEEIVMGDDLIVDTAILQPSNGAVRTTVSTTPDSIAYLSLGYLDESVKALSVDGVEATQANALSGEYPVVRPLNLMTDGEPNQLVAAWLQLILGPVGQAVVGAEGYLPLN